jgi:large subunit ribosomal protein L21
VERLDAEEGAAVELPVLAVSDGKRLTVGKPKVDKAAVKAKVVEHGKEKKVLVMKKKRRKDYKKKNVSNNDIGYKS